MTSRPMREDSPDAPSTDLDDREAALEHLSYWVRDPTGETAVRNLMHRSKSDDFAIVTHGGEVVFRIKGDVLALVLPLFTFTPSRRNKSVRAYPKKKAFTNGAATPGEGHQPNL